MKCLDIDKPRALSLDALDWEDNQIVRCFRGCGLADGFVKIWKHQFLPNIDQVDGTYSIYEKVSSKKLLTPPTTPTGLLPASKRARLEEKSVCPADSVYDECEMDVIIRQH